MKHRIKCRHEKKLTFDTKQEAYAHCICSDCRVVKVKTPNEVRGDERERCAKHLEQLGYRQAPEILRGLP